MKTTILAVIVMISMTVHASASQPARTPEELRAAADKILNAIDEKYGNMSLSELAEALGGSGQADIWENIGRGAAVTSAATGAALQDPATATRLENNARDTVAKQAAAGEVNAEQRKNLGLKREQSANREVRANMASMVRNGGFGEMSASSVLDANGKAISTRWSGNIEGADNIAKFQSWLKAQRQNDMAKQVGRMAGAGRLGVDYTTDSKGRFVKGNGEQGGVITRADQGRAVAGVNLSDDNSTKIDTSVTNNSGRVHDNRVIQRSGDTIQTKGAK